MKQPLVTISIPTRNSAAFLPICLQAIRNQTYKNIEVNIVDAISSDATRNIAKEFGVTKVYSDAGSLLAARYTGVKHARGEYVLLLDSDQVLQNTTIERAVATAENEKIQVIALEEGVYKPHSLLERLFELDRKVINTVSDMNPFTGVILPRFYERDLLLNALKRIPAAVLNEVGGQDHAIIYFEVWNLNNRGIQISDAVSHIEPSNYVKMWQKFYRWGKTSVGAHHERYTELLTRKERFRNGMFKPGLILASTASILLLLLKGIPYKLGYYMAKITR